MLSTGHTHVDKDLLLEFFLSFSRFEYALKASGFFQRATTIRHSGFVPPDAKPDWDRFAVSLRGYFDKARHRELSNACDYILENPPWKQVVVNGSLLWESPVRPNGQSDVEFLLRMVRCVRNNLFHGGKFSDIELQENTDRTENLLRSALIILNECLHLYPQVKREFDEAVI